MLPGRALGLWTNGSRWLVNPNSGYEVLNMRRHDSMFPCYLRAPDRTFWEAAGFHDSATELTAKFNDRLGRRSLRMLDGH